MDENDIIYGRNTVREALKSPERVERLLIARDTTDASVRELAKRAKNLKITVTETDRQKIDELTMAFGYNGKPANHQGVCAYVAAHAYCEIEDILQKAQERGEPPFVIVLDGVTDPGNFGSIIRSAEVFGAHGVVVQKRRHAPLNSAVSKISSGAAENMLVARVSNISDAVEKLKRSGVWTIAANIDGQNAQDVDMSGAAALVIGSEGEGIGRLVRERCDFSASIPMRGSIGSLNAAMAAAVLMYEKRRQDGAKNA